MLKTLARPIAAAVALAFCLSATAGAETSDHLTRFTFNQPFSIPGVTLPAGTYTFKLADPTGGRRIVQVLDERGMESFALLQALPAYRANDTQELALSLMDTVPGVPAAIKTWWPLGERTGFEFIYPESQSARLTGLEPLAMPPLPRAAVGVAPVRVAAATASRAATSEPVVAMQVMPGVAMPLSEEQEQQGPSRAVIALLGALTLFLGAWTLGRARV